MSSEKWKGFSGWCLVDVRDWSRSELEDREGLMGHAGSPGLTASKGTGSSVVKLRRIAFRQPPE